MAKESIFSGYTDPILLPLKLIMAMLGFFFLTLLFGWFIECLGVLVDFWDQPGVEHSQYLIDEELKQLLVSAEEINNGDKIQKIGGSLFQTINYYIFDWTGLGGLINFVVSKNIFGISPALEILTNIINLTILRTIVAIWYGATYLLVCIAGVLNGIHTRNVRIQCAAPVSGKIFGFAARMMPFTLFLPPMFYIAVPYKTDPSLVLGLPAIMFAVFVSVAISRYKPVI